MKRSISRDGLAFALNYEVDRSRGVAVGFGFFAAAQHLGVAIHGGERRASGDRIDVFKDHSVVRAALLAGQTLQLIIGGLPFVGHRQASFGIHTTPSRPGPARVQLHAIAGVDHRLFHAAVLLVKDRVHVSDKWRVDGIQPNYRLVAGVFVVMPGLLRRQNEIVLLHVESFAVDDGVSLWVSSCYKAEGAHAVTMRPCHLTRPEHLKPDAQRQGRSLGRDSRVGKEQTALPPSSKSKTSPAWRIMLTIESH